MTTKSCLISAALLVASLTLSAQSETLDQAAERFGEFLTDCSLSLGSENESLSAAEKLAMNAMMESVMESVVDDLKSELAEENVDPKVLSTCVDSMEALGCAALETDEPPASCEAIGEAMD